MSRPNDMPTPLNMTIKRKPVPRGLQIPNFESSSTDRVQSLRSISEVSPRTTEHPTARSSVMESSRSTSIRFSFIEFSSFKSIRPVSTISLAGTYLRARRNPGKIVGPVCRLAHKASARLKRQGRKLTAKIPADARALVLYRQYSARVKKSVRTNKLKAEYKLPIARRAVKSALFYEEGEERPHPGDGCEVLDLAADRINHALKGRPKVKPFKGRRRIVMSDGTLQDLTEKRAGEPADSLEKAQCIEGDSQQSDAEKQVFTIDCDGKTIQVHPEDHSAFLRYITTLETPTTALRGSTNSGSSNIQSNETRSNEDIDEIYDLYYRYSTASLTSRRSGLQVPRSSQSLESNGARLSGSKSVKSVNTVRHVCTSSTDGWVPVASLTGGQVLSNDATDSVEAQVPQSDRTTLRSFAAQQHPLPELQRPITRMNFNRFTQGEPGEGYVSWKPDFKAPDSNHKFPVVPKYSRLNDNPCDLSPPPTPAVILRGRPLTVVNATPLPSPKRTAEAAAPNAGLPMVQETQSLVRRVAKITGKGMRRFLREWEEG